MFPTAEKWWRDQICMSCPREIRNFSLMPRPENWNDRSNDFYLSLRSSFVSISFQSYSSPVSSLSRYKMRGLEWKCTISMFQQLNSCKNFYTRRLINFIVKLLSFYSLKRSLSQHPLTIYALRQVSNEPEYSIFKIFLEVKRYNIFI